MPKDEPLKDTRKNVPGNSEEVQSLLSGAPNGDLEDGDSLVLPTSQFSTPQRPRVNTKPPQPQRQSSLSRPAENGTPKTPRTANRVRFIDDELGNGNDGVQNAVNENGQIPLLARGSAIGATTGGTGSMAGWIEEEDYLSHHNAAARGDRRSSMGQRAPLLTDIEAPSVTVATSGEDFNAEDLLETARPKSGMRSAFMNMANSIIGAGIIGQPYAFRQAGLATGIILLVALTVTVDWTIRLIVVNSMLSGANSFQATLQHCYGKSGLIAISVWYDSRRKVSC